MAIQNLTKERIIIYMKQPTKEEVWKALNKEYCTREERKEQIVHEVYARLSVKLNTCDERAANYREIAKLSTELRKIQNG